MIHDYVHDGDHIYFDCLLYWDGHHFYFVWHMLVMVAGVPFFQDSWIDGSHK
jgi:hypothetical protein